MKVRLKKTGEIIDIDYVREVKTQFLYPFSEVEFLPEEDVYCAYCERLSGGLRCPLHTVKETPEPLQKESSVTVSDILKKHKVHSESLEQDLLLYLERNYWI